MNNDLGFEQNAFKLMVSVIERERMISVEKLSFYLPILIYLSSFYLSHCRFPTLLK